MGKHCPRLEGVKMARRLRKKLVQQHQDLVAQYRRAFKNKPFKTIDVVDWATKRGLIHLRPIDPRFLLADEIAQAMHEEYISDPQGRRVRAKHAARYEVNGKQETFWADIRDKNPGTRRHMQIAFQNRRQQIVGECVQLKLDLDSYNQNWNPGTPIQSCFDFTDDLADRGLADTA
jgi:hypothetical protein